MNNPVIAINYIERDKWELYITGRLIKVGTLDEIGAYFDGYVQGILEFNERSK